MIKENEDPKKNPFIAGGEAAEKEQKKESEDPDKNPLVPGGKAAEKELERERQRKFESPATNPFMKGGKEGSGLDIEEHFQEHDVLALGKFSLVKNYGEPGTFKLIGDSSHEIEFESLEEATKVLEGLSPEEIGKLFFK